jgi:hypothetical protein
MPGIPKTPEQGTARAKLANLFSRGYTADDIEVQAAKTALIRANQAAENVARVNAVVEIWARLDDAQRARFADLLAPPQRKETV